MLSKEHIAVYFESNYDMEILIFLLCEPEYSVSLVGLSRMHVLLCMVILICVALPFNSLRHLNPKCSQLNSYRPDPNS